MFCANINKPFHAGKQLLRTSGKFSKSNFFFLFFICSTAHASIDPFDTEKLVPPRPALQLQEKSIDPCAAVLPDHPLDLLEVVNLALCNNPKTHEVWASTRAQAELVGVGKAAYLPSIDVNASASRNKTGSAPAVNQRNAGVTLSYLLYDFGARSANLDYARELLIAASATQDSTVQAIFLATIQDYYQTQASVAALDAAKESEQAARESFAAAEARYKAGSATPADKLQSQTAYSQATLNRITADGNLKNAQGSLANRIGIDANRNVSLATVDTTALDNKGLGDFEGGVNSLIEQARQHRPDLRAAEAQVKAAQASTEAARAAGRPTISLTASADQNNTAGINTHSSAVGIHLNIPIFNGFAPTYRVRAAEAQVDVKNAQLEQLRLQVALDVWTAYQHLVTATQSLRSSADLLDSAKQSEQVALGRYKAGVGSILDVLNAQSALAGARQQRIQSAFNWNISRAALAQAMGSLDGDLLQTLSGSYDRNTNGLNNSEQLKSQQ